MNSRALKAAAALALTAAGGAVLAEGSRTGEAGNPPSTHQPVPGAARANAAGAEQTSVDANPAVPLVLSDAERALVLESVDVHGESTLALGFLTVGADVPRSIELKGFPDAILKRVSKLEGYKYFSAEGRIAIVDPSHAKVEMVIGPRR
jgi:hypothetical protein